MSYCDRSTLGIGSVTTNGRFRAATGDKTPERSPYELLAWAALEQAVDDLAIMCRWGIITEEGECLPWPTRTKFACGYWITYNVAIANLRGPNDHHQLKAWFLSEDAKEFCDLIGCRLDPVEIFSATVRNNAK